MGCFWSNQDCERCQYCNRKAVNNLIIVNDICQICTDRTQRGQQVYIPQTQRVHLGNGPYFGEYKCKSCGRFWNSRLCWPNTYQICKKCSRPVYAYNSRALRSSDVSNADDNNIREHPKELCQKCKQLGHYCGGNKNINRNKKYSRQISKY